MDLVDENTDLTQAFVFRIAYLRRLNRLNRKSSRAHEMRRGLSASLVRTRRSKAPE